MKAKCDNCTRVWQEDKIVPLSHARDLGERLDPGSEVPMGECPKCHSLCYAHDPKVRVVDELRELAGEYGNDGGGNDGEIEVLGELLEEALCYLSDTKKQLLLAKPAAKKLLKLRKK